MNIKDIEEDVKEFDTSQRYQDVYKWFMYCKELLSLLEGENERAKKLVEALKHYSKVMLDDWATENCQNKAKAALAKYEGVEE